MKRIELLPESGLMVGISITRILARQIGKRMDEINFIGTAGQLVINELDRVRIVRDENV